MQDARSAWEDKRGLNCVKPAGRRRQHEQLNISSYAAEESFSEFFNVGTVVPLGEWLENQGFDLKKIGNEAKQKAFAKEAHQFFLWSGKLCYAQLSSGGSTVLAAAAYTVYCLSGTEIVYFVSAVAEIIQHYYWHWLLAPNSPNGSGSSTTF